MNIVMFPPPVVSLAIVLISALLLAGFVVHDLLRRR